MSAWRAAGLNYLNYSSIAAKVLRQALKEDARKEAAKRSEALSSVTPWINGKPQKPDMSTTEEKL